MPGKLGSLRDIYYCTTQFMCFIRERQVFQLATGQIHFFEAGMKEGSST